MTMAIYGFGMEHHGQMQVKFVGHKVFRDKKEIKENKVIKGRREIRAAREIKEKKALRVIRDCGDIKVTGVTRDIRENKVIRETRVHPEVMPNVYGIEHIAHTGI
jgi:hypothetical protein